MTGEVYRKEELPEGWEPQQLYLKKWVPLDRDGYMLDPLGAVSGMTFHRSPMTWKEADEAIGLAMIMNRGPS